MKYEVCKEYSFAAAHKIELAIDVKCARKHGHNYKVVVCVGITVPELPSIGYIIDFVELDNIVKPIIAKYDHRDLNEVLFTANASAEFLATKILESIDGKEDHALRKLATNRGASDVQVKVTVYETDKARVTVEGD